MSFDCLIFGCGGLNGCTMLGRLAYLADYQKIDLEKIKIVGGTSIGAALALLISVGYTPIEILNFLLSWFKTHKKPKSSMKNLIYGTGKYNIQDFLTCIQSAVDLKMPNPTLGQLPITFCCCSISLTSQKLEYFNSIDHPNMNALDAIRLSCAIPGIFAPQKYNNQVFIDGGLIKNTPITFINTKFQPTKILVIEVKSTNFVGSDIDRWLPKHFLNVLFLPAYMEHYKDLENVQTNVLISIVEPKTKFFNLEADGKLFKKMFEEGYYPPAE